MVVGYVYCFEFVYFWFDCDCGNVYVWVYSFFYFFGGVVVDYVVLVGYFGFDYVVDFVGR